MGAPRLPRTTLLIEDDDGVRDTLVDILSDRGHPVVGVATGAAARAVADPPAVAVVDIVLPDADGLSVARELRDRFPDVDLVFLTANATIDSAIGAVAVGAARYLQKPCHPTALLELIDELYQRRELRDEAERQARRVRLVADLLSRLIGTLDYDKVVGLGTERLLHASGALGVGLYTWDSEGRGSVHVAGTLSTRLRARLDDAEWVAALGAEPESGATTALSVDGDPTHTLYVCIGRGRRLRPTAFYQHAALPDDSELIQLMTSQLGVALQRADLHRQLERAFEQLRATHMNLIEAEKQSAVGRLAAGIAHEIGTPLNIISGRAEVLLGRAEPGSVMTRGLNIICGQTDRIARLVRQLLDYSRAEDTERKPIRLSAVLAETLPLLETQRKVQMEARVSRSLRPVFGSFHQIQQVLLNLVLNAVDARATRVEISAKSSDEAGVVLISVTDDGDGIPESKLETVFEPFYTTKGRGKGTGLGLAVVRGIVRDHGGDIWAERVETGGTRFTFSLPFAK